jgi:hypothetical protein
LKKNSPYYTYLEPFLETGDEALIAKAKKEYFKEYKRNWRKEFRAKNMEIAISWSKEEYKELQKNAKEHTLSTTQYIKQATIAYASKRYIVPEKTLIQKGIQYLGMTYTSIEHIEESERINLKEIKEKIDQLEKEFREVIFSPHTIEQIIDTLLKNEPELKPYLLTYISNK